MSFHRIAAVLSVSWLLGVSSISMPFSASAEETKIEVTDPNVVKAGLEHLVGKSVTIRLSGGEDVSGVVEAVGPAAVRVGQLTGKEFYSAIVKLDSIVGFIYRAK